MKALPASLARKNFRALLADLGDESVALHRYGKTVAYIVPAHRLPATGANPARDQARRQQQSLERDRLERHLRIALELLSAPAARTRTMIKAAKAKVARWESEQLCSEDYISRWRRLLAQPLPKLAVDMCNDAGGWGPALRQNSPWT